VVRYLVVLSRSDIKDAFILRQGLSADPTWRSVHEALNQIGAVQIDTIAVVARSHHLTLRHRVKDYNPEQLWKALRERELLEYYVHGNSFVPIEDFPYIRHCMQRFSTHGYKWLRNSIPKYQDLMQKILQRIQEEGPLTSRDFKDTKHRSGGWWNWKPAKSALSLLWWMGQIVVIDRKGFERVYDITERAIPSKYLDHHVSIEEVWSYFLQRTIDCLVIATINDIKDYFRFQIYALDKKKSEMNTLAEKVEVLLQEDIIKQVEVEGNPRPHYVLCKNLLMIENAQNHTKSPDRAWFLSPFDNIVWDRRRVHRLFDVDVKLEAYHPPSKRQFGYYAMPILWNNCIVGRLDPKVNHKTNTLTLANLELILPKKDRELALEAIRNELVRFMDFHACKRHVLEKVRPAEMKKKLS